ncbi:MAG: hypothetical protein CVU28_10265 [Betaproteobacteria bacterium HGW-Betaproteobacteria-21]|nr:MAG: hypothetical protein CVU28_10265 [Betaproteobacteria bacterium HGW-Betaproteobacteria-21]
MRAMLVLALCGLLQTGAAAAVPLPPALTAERVASDVAYRQLGSGEMRWFGLKVYDAALWVPAGSDWSADSAFALAIRYARNIAGDKLVDSSIDEMRRLGFGDEARLTRWRSELIRALPTVAPGEILVGARIPGAGARFWHDGKPTAELGDPDLARAFFAIWLDSRTREPALRARLLGEDRAPR